MKYRIKKALNITLKDKEIEHLKSVVKKEELAAVWLSQLEAQLFRSNGA